MVYYQDHAENSPLIRKMQLSDIQRICEIELEAFTTPWTEAAFYNELVNNHFAHYLVIEWQGQVVGYGGMWTIVDEAHITNIAITTAFRGRKWGEWLMFEMQALACVYGAVRMTLEVRVSNTIALKLYEKMGFVATGFRKGYYSDNNEDAIIMWADLPDCAETQNEAGSVDG